MVDYLKITEADRLLCLPSNTAPPVISSTWLINISIPVVAPFPIAEGGRDIPRLPSVLQTPLLTKQKAPRSVADANNSRAAYLLRRDRISSCPRRRLPQGRSAAAPGLCVVSSAGPTTPASCSSCLCRRAPAARSHPPRRAGSPHSAPAAGGEGPLPAAGTGSWKLRSKIATLPGCRVIF